MILVFLAELDKTASMSVIGDDDGADSIRVSAFDLFAVTIVINLVKKEKKKAKKKRTIKGASSSLELPRGGLRVLHEKKVNVFYLQLHIEIYKYNY